MYDYKEKAFNVIDAAQGSQLKTHRKSQIVDSISCLFNCNIGYGNEKVISAITEQLKRMSTATLFRLSHEPSIQLAKILCGLTKEHYQHVFFVNSGSEATDTAIKIARQYFWNQGLNKYKIMSFKGGYHGSTFGAISACSFDEDREPFGPLIDGFIHCDVYNANKVDEFESKEEGINYYLNVLTKQIIDNDPKTIAALIFEPIQLCNNANILPKEYVQGVRRLCQQHDILLIADEVATGFGRTGTMFAMEPMGFYPDMMLLAKGITSGYIPLGATMITEKIFQTFLQKEPYERFRMFRHGSTSSGNPAACSAALANIDVISEQNLIENTKEMGNYMLQQMKKFEKYPFIQKVCGKGLILCIIFDKLYIEQYSRMRRFSFYFRDMACNKGILLFPNADAGEAVLLAPVLNITKDEVDLILRLVEQTIKKCCLYFESITIEEIAANGIDS